MQLTSRDVLAAVAAAFEVPPAALPGPGRRADAAEPQPRHGAARPRTGRDAPGARGRVRRPPGGGPRRAGGGPPWRMRPLRRRGWLRAVAASNAAGLAVDSALFLWLAFGSLDFLAGQVLGKAWMTALAVALLWAIRWPLVQARAA
jgi:hypothetical protein